MKKTLIMMFGISVFAGLGYLAWAYTPLGKGFFGRWLLRRWTKMAAVRGKVLPEASLKAELSKLDYLQHEWLFRLTRLDAVEKERKQTLTPKEGEQYTVLLARLSASGTFEKADLTPLENIILPS